MPNNSSKSARLIVIVGPTGVGKTSVALKLARSWGGEIINADSMQVYRYMDIGTAKPPKSERAEIPHHLIDVVNPDEPFNAAIYAEAAGKIISGAGGENKIFFLVGGTGLYIRALLEGIVSCPGADESLRSYYRDQVKRFGRNHLYGLLKDKDGKAAELIKPHDTVRVIRALEVWELSGRSIVDMQREQKSENPLANSLKIGLAMEREELVERIENRCEEMIDSGLVEEVIGLLDRGYSESLKSMQSLGYRHMVSYVKGRSSFGEARESMKRDTRRYAKRQMTWFKADKDVRWFSGDDISNIHYFLTCRRY